MDAYTEKREALRELLLKLAENPEMVEEIRIKPYKVLKQSLKESHQKKPTK